MKIASGLFALAAMAGAFAGDYGYESNNKRLLPVTHNSSKSELLRFFYSLSKDKKEFIKTSPDGRIEGENVNNYWLRMAIKKAIR